MSWLRSYRTRSTARAFAGASLSGRLWAIEPDALSAIQSVTAEAISSGRIIRAGEGEGSGKPGELPVRQGIAVVPMFGLLERHSTWLSQVFGSTSLTDMAGAIGSALADPSVRGILIYADSPGGTVDGTEEVANLLAANRVAADGKPVVTYSEGSLCSAAYWIGAQAHAIVAAPGAEVGSLGVIYVREDWSRSLDAAGVSVNRIVYPGPAKGENMPEVEMSDDARSGRQASVTATGERMYESIAAARGTTIEELTKSYGAGRVYVAPLALERGMVEEVGTIGDAIMLLEQLAGIAPAPEVMSMAPEDIRAAVASAVAEALGPVASAIEGLAKSEQELAKQVSASLKTSSESALRARLEAAATDGKIAPGEVESEFEMLKAVGSELREARLSIIEARTPTVPRTPAPARQSATGGEAITDRQSWTVQGGTFDAGEARAVMAAEREGLTGEALIQRVAELTKEVADA